MAEGALFSLATNLLSTLSSLEYKKAHVSKADIEKLRRSVEAIHSVLLDAEKQQESSAAVKDWIRQVGNALYDADDLFDEILTIRELKQQTEGSKIQNQVRVFFSLSNPLNYAHEASTRLKALSKSLDQASKDIKMFCFVQSQHEEQVPVVARQGSLVDSKEVIGRNAEVKDILDFLLTESPCEEKDVPVFAVVGIGGMGKTTLARLVYNTDAVERKFEKRWWASVSGKDEDTEILRGICEAGKYLLVIDGAWDEDHTRWSERMKLLQNGCVGSRIIVTTRSPLVARAMEAVKIQKLSGLSEKDSWELFKTIAFTPEMEDDPMWTSLGKVIVNKCLGVPLAITRIASHLYGRSMEEWEHFMNEELSKIELSDNVVTSVLKLSYDRLPSELKQCFAYCALFPKDFVISKQKLLYLWIAQGYVKPDPDKQTAEEIGDEYLKQLLSISFLEKAEQDEDSEIEHYKMHDLVHDLARHVAGDDVAVLTDHSIRSRSARHASVGYDKFRSSETLPELPNVDRLRTYLITGAGSQGSQVIIRRQVVRLQCLRALDLSGTGIDDVPRSIGGLEHLRYLNLSRNRFESLPDSISKLCNLVTLDISGCERLKAWPKNTRRLIKLRHLEYSHCPGLTQMPDGFGELTYLQHLSDFKPSSDKKMLEAFSKLTLKGKLTIEFAKDHVQGDDNNNDNNDDCWQLPVTVVMLRICSYLGASLPRWRNEMPAAIVRLELHCCENLKRLPALRVLPNLRILVVNGSRDLEYVEEEATSSMASFPCIEELSLVRLPGLKGWSRAVKLEGCVFPRLRKLEIAECPGMELWGDDGNRGVEWDSLSALRTLKILPMPTSERLPHCLQQRNVQIVEYSFPPEPAPVEDNQTSDDDSVQCSPKFQPCGILIA